jgi:hypothetical protein
LAFLATATLVGMALRGHLPDHYLAAEPKDVIVWQAPWSERRRRSPSDSSSFCEKRLRQRGCGTAEFRRACGFARPRLGPVRREDLGGSWPRLHRLVEDRLKSGWGDRDTNEGPVDPDDIYRRACSGGDPRAFQVSGEIAEAQGRRSRRARKGILPRLL